MTSPVARFRENFTDVVNVMCIGRADKIYIRTGTRSVEEIVPCRVRTEFKSLTFQVFGDESELRENTETGFVNMGWMKMPSSADGTFDRVYIDIQGRDQEAFFFVCDLFFGIHDDLEPNLSGLFLYPGDGDRGSAGMR